MNGTTAKLKGKKAIVTGGAGFIGSHLSRALVEAGAEVHIIDNLSSGKKTNVPEEASFHEGDIRHLDQLLKIFKKIGRADFVFHLAAVPEVEISKANPFKTNETNVTGTDNVLYASYATKAGKVVFASSAAVYGSNTKIPASEDDMTHPVNPYGYQKLIGEHYCALFSSTCGLPTVCLRYFNVYGPNQPMKSSYSGVITIFLSKAKAGSPLSIVGDGSQTRDFVHVSDIVRANILAALSDCGSGETFNIGSGTQHTIKDLALLISKHIEHVEPRDEAKASCADITKAEAMLGWRPEVSLSTGIDELKRLADI